MSAFLRERSFLEDQKEVCHPMGVTNHHFISRKAKLIKIKQNKNWINKICKRRVCSIHENHSYLLSRPSLPKPAQPLPALRSTWPRLIREERQKPCKCREKNNSSFCSIIIRSPSLVFGLWAGDYFHVKINIWAPPFRRKDVLMELKKISSISLFFKQQ